jgi:hypothetical protein
MCIDTWAKLFFRDIFNRATYNQQIYKKVLKKSISLKSQKYIRLRKMYKNNIKKKKIK